LLVTHIAVRGYWLGTELVINAAYRCVSYGSNIPSAEHNQLVEHVVNVDRHVRYALVPQIGLGFALVALYGLMPGCETTAWIVSGLCVWWLALIEAVHRHALSRRRQSPGGESTAPRATSW
jgi:hypothetical protein